MTVTEMLLLFIAMLATLGLALTGRLAGRRGADPQVLTMIQLGVMTVISGASILTIPSIRESARYMDHNAIPILLAGGIGVAIGNFCYLRALACGPTGLVLIIVSLSVLVPSAVSILFFGDQLSNRQALGCGLALLAIVLMTAHTKTRKTDAVHWTTLALAAMLLLGLYQTEGKHFQVISPIASDQFYIAGSGLCAAVTSLYLIVRVGGKLRRLEFCCGGALGGFGLIQMLCILGAQRTLPVSTVYLSVFGGSPILMLIVATALLKEHYSSRIWCGALIGIVGICLMI